MAYPQYDEMDDPLLCFILLYGGDNHVVDAGFTYEPLADFFGLTATEQTAPRSDGGSGTQWQSRVQWARQRLINQGLIVDPPKDRSERGHWTLSPEGVQRARLAVGQYRRLQR
jgi:hypothetical protein